MLIQSEENVKKNLEKKAEDYIIKNYLETILTSISINPNFNYLKKINTELLPFNKIIFDEKFEEFNKSITNDEKRYQNKNQKSTFYSFNSNKTKKIFTEIINKIINQRKEDLKNLDENIEEFLTKNYRNNFNKNSLNIYVEDFYKNYIKLKFNFDTELKELILIKIKKKIILKNLDKEIKIFLNIPSQSQYNFNSFYENIINKYKYEYNDQNLKKIIKLQFEIKEQNKIIQSKVEINNEDESEDENEEEKSENENEEEEGSEESGSSYESSSGSSYKSSSESSYKSIEKDPKKNPKKGGANSVYTGHVRHFKLVKVNGKDYKNTSNADIKENQSPLSAASKLLGSYCRSEGIKKNDRPKMKPITFSIQETTKGSKEKIFGPYHGYYIKYTPAQVKKASVSGITFTMKPIVKRFKK